jgi:hypothetical protein
MGGWIESAAATSSHDGTVKGGELLVIYEHVIYSLPLRREGRMGICQGKCHSL